MVAGHTRRLMWCDHALGQNKVCGMDMREALNATFYLNYQGGVWRALSAHVRRSNRKTSSSP